MASVEACVDAVNANPEAGGIQVGFYQLKREMASSDAVKLLVDPISARYLAGAEVDFVDNITGGGFTIKNPNAKSTCGCGSSFSV